MRTVTNPALDSRHSIMGYQVAVFIFSFRRPLIPLSYHIRGMALGDTRRLALDIETISPHLAPEDDPDYDNPEEFEVAAIGFAYDGHEAGDRLPRREVLFRSDPDARSELNFLSRIAHRIITYDPNEIVTYAGEFFDLPILKQRPVLVNDTAAGHAVSNSFEIMTDTAESVDLSDPAAETYGFGTSLEDIIKEQNELGVRKTHFTDYDHELDLDAVRPYDSETEHMASADVFSILEVWLYARSEAHDDIGPCNVDVVEEMLTDYIIGDIEHLLTLADRLPFER